MPDLPYQRATRIRNREKEHSNGELLTERTGGPNCVESVFPEDTNLPQPNTNLIIEDIIDEEADALMCREKFKDPTRHEESIIEPIFCIYVKIRRFKPSPLRILTYIVHALSSGNGTPDDTLDETINSYYSKILCHNHSPLVKYYDYHPILEKKWDMLHLGRLLVSLTVRLLI